MKLSDIPDFISMIKEKDFSSLISLVCSIFIPIVFYFISGELRYVALSAPLLLITALFRANFLIFIELYKIISDNLPNYAGDVTLNGEISIQIIKKMSPPLVATASDGYLKKVFNRLRKEKRIIKVADGKWYFKK